MAVEKIPVNSGFVICPGVVDYDAIISDIRIPPSNVKEEIWPWWHVSTIKCKLWHKTGKQQLSEGMPESLADVCGEWKLVPRKMLVLREKKKSLHENDRLQRQQALQGTTVHFEPRKSGGTVSPTSLNKVFVLSCNC